MRVDGEGFAYPVVDTAKCIDCHLCERVCPVLHQAEERVPLSVLAAKNRDESVRLASSSGGIFSLLAEKIIENGGVVFGAKFNSKWEVIHDFAETTDELTAFRGSKYVQSQLGDSYAKVKAFLEQGRRVMFTGTSCQVAGLNHYLRREYDNLLTVDVVCHGVPSPLVWQNYLNEFARQGEGKNTVLLSSLKTMPVITGIDFRDKKPYGWKKYSFALTLSEATAEGEKNSVLLSHKFTENAFMQAFLANVTLRPSCYACPAKAGRAGADITIADFWGIEKALPTFDDNKGVSLVLCYSEKGRQAIANIDCEVKHSSFQDAIKSNPSVMHSVSMPINRGFFFHRLKRSGSYNTAWDNYNSNVFFMRLYRFVYRLMRKK